MTFLDTFIENAERAIEERKARGDAPVMDTSHPYPTGTRLWSRTRQVEVEVAMTKKGHALIRWPRGFTQWSSNSHIKEYYNTL